MWRTVKTVIVMTFLLSHAHAEDVISTSPWSAAAAVPGGLTSGVIRVQEPFCEYGVGPCGGTCSEEGGKQWACAGGEMPCYQLGHCKCEVAAVCKAPAAAPKKKKINNNSGNNTGGGEK